LFRVGLACLIWVRTTDWFGGVLTLDHRHWMSGVEYAPRLEAVREPALVSPLFSFMPQLPDGALELAAYARPLLALPLALGLWPRATAALLGCLGYGLMALDRYRYLHHLHLLWLSCGLLVLCPSHGALSIHVRARRALQPRWPLQLLRFQALVAYAAAGSAKLGADWLSGHTLIALERMGLISGPFWQYAHAVVGYRALACVVALTELALVGLLAWRWTRASGVVLALTLHATLASALMLSTFSLQMALYVMLFLPWRERLHPAQPT
jgi:hypothetical protein